MMRLTVDNIFVRVNEGNPKTKIPRMVVQYWLESAGRQNLKDMNERQLGKIKWNDRAFERFRGFDKETRMFGNRKIVHMDEVEETVKAEYDKLPPNIARDTFFDYLQKRFVGISRRALERFLKLQPSYQKSRGRITQSLAKSIVLSKPFQRCLIDLIDSSKVSKEGNQFPFTLTCIDGFSKFVYAEALRNKEQSTVEKAFAKILERTPKRWKQCQCDNGSEFVNFPKFFPEIKFIFSSPYLPQSNSIIERFHRFLKKYIYWAQEKKKLSYPKQLEKILELYNDRKHTITKLTPKQVHKTNLSEIDREQVKKRIQREANKRNPPQRTFAKIDKGSYVRLAILRKSNIDKIYQQWSDEVYEVVQVRKDNTYKIKNIGGKDDGKVRPYIYQRDYLLAVPEETGKEAKKGAEDETRKEQEERARSEMEQEEQRQRVAERRQERMSFNFDFDKWREFFDKNQVFEFKKGNAKYKVHSVFRLTRSEKKLVSESEGKNKIWVAFYKARQSRPPTRREAEFDQVFTTNFVKNTLNLTNYSVNDEE